VPAFRVKLGANDLNCVDVLLNPTHSLTVTSTCIIRKPSKCLIHSDRFTEYESFPKGSDSP